MGENNLSKALREVVSLEFSDIPLQENEIPHTFSKEFLLKMDKLIKAEKSRVWRMRRTASRGIVVILVALLFIILTACSMPSGRAAVVNFIKEIYENCIHLFTGEAGSIENSEHYILIELPDVFAEIKIVYEGNLSASSNKRNTTAVTAVFWGLS